MLFQRQNKIRQILCLTLISFFLSYTLPVLAASNPPVVILVNGFGDCCAHRMERLIDGLKQMGATFPSIAKRGLDESQYIHYVTPWNSFSGLDQGFQVDMNPQTYVAKAMGESLSRPSGLLNKLQGSSTMVEDQGMMDNILGMVRKGSDGKFIDEVSRLVNEVGAETPVILIGHSFGADSIMDVLPKIRRNILFVGVLDPVGSGGQRRLNRGTKIPSHVSYFYNRWQNNELFPFDYMTNGNFDKCRASIKCDQKKQRMARSKNGEVLSKSLTHVEIPYDAFIQEEIIGIISQLLKGKTPSSANALPTPKAQTTKAPTTKKSLKSKLLQSVPSTGLFGR